MKAKMLLLSAAFALTPLLSGQVNCTSYTQFDTHFQPVLNVSQGPLVCQYPFNATALAQTYFGGNITQIEKNPTTEAIFIGLVAAGGAVTAPFNASIASQLAQLPMPSAAVGTVTLKSSPTDVGSPYDNLGPILADRPDTLPKHGLFLSFAYQHFNFTEIDGIGLGSVSLAAVLHNTPTPSNYNGNTGTINCTANPSLCGDFYVGLRTNINMNLNQYIALLTYGLTHSTDISVAVPINSVTVKTTSSQYNAFFYGPYSTAQGQFSSPQYTELAIYDPNHPSAQTPLVTSGSANGIGDVTVNIKQMLLGKEGRYALAAGVLLRFPSGDSSNYLGSGAYGANIYALMEYRGTYKSMNIAPHLKFGYQWNSDSQIMDILNPPHQQLPGGLAYAFGADFGLYHHKYTNVTLAIDGVGNQYVNAPVLTSSSLSLPAVPPSQATLVIPSSLPTVAPTTTTYATFNFSGGVKYQISKHFIVYGNVLVPVNNVGLHSDPVPLVGIAFKK